MQDRSRLSLLGLLKALPRLSVAGPWIMSSEFLPDGSCQLVHMDVLPAQCVILCLFSFILMLLGIIFLNWHVAVWGCALIILAGITSYSKFGFSVYNLRISTNGALSIATCSFLCFQGKSVHPGLNVVDVSAIRVNTRSREYVEIDLRDDAGGIFTTLIKRPDPELIVFAIHMFYRHRGVHILGDSSSLFLTPRNTRNERTPLIAHSKIDVCGAWDWRGYLSHVCVYFTMSLIVGVIEFCVFLTIDAISNSRKMNVFYTLAFAAGMAACLFLFTISALPVGRKVFFVDQKYFLFSTRFLFFRWSTTVPSNELQGICFCEELCRRSFWNRSADQPMNTWVYFLHSNSYNVVVLRDCSAEDLTDDLKAVCVKFEETTLQTIRTAVADCDCYVPKDIVQEIVSFMEAPKQTVDNV